MSPASPMHQIKSIGSIKLENPSTGQNLSGPSVNDFKIVDTSENLRKILKRCSICHFTTYIQENKQTCRNCSEIQGPNFEFGIPAPEGKTTIHERQKMPSFTVKPKSNIKYCSICKVNFGSFELLSAHVDKNHEDHKCKICDRVFLLKEFRIKHDSIVHHHEKQEASNKPHQCKYCQKRFEFEFTLKKHFELVHTRTFNGQGGAKRFHCYMCSISFNFKLQMKNHLAEIHDLKESRYTCELCGFEPKNKTQNAKEKLNEKYDHLLFFHFKQDIAELNKDLKIENGKCPFQNCQFKTEENNEDGTKPRQHWTVLRHYTCQHGILRKLLTEALTKIHSTNNVILPSKKIKDESRAFLDEKGSKIDEKNTTNMANNIRDNVVVCDINEIINKKIDNKSIIQPIKNESTNNRFHENLPKNDFTDIQNKEKFVEEDNGHLDLDYIAGDAANNVALFISDPPPEEKSMEINNPNDGTGSTNNEDFENITIMTVDGEDIMAESNEIVFPDNFQNDSKSEHFENDTENLLGQDFVQDEKLENFDDPLDVGQDDKLNQKQKIKPENNFGQMEDFENLIPENIIETKNDIKIAEKNNELKSEKRKLPNNSETSNEHPRKIRKIDTIEKANINPKNECIKCDFCSQYSLSLAEVRNRNEGVRELKKHIAKVHGILALKKFLSMKKVDSDVTLGEKITPSDNTEKTPKTEISRQGSSEDFKSACSICGFKPVTNKKNTYNNILRFHMMKTHLRNR